VVVALMLSWSGQAVARRSTGEFDVLCVRCAADRAILWDAATVSGRRDRV